jgi:hypothetical protein
VPGWAGWVGVWAPAAVVAAAKMQASRAVLVFVVIPSPFRVWMRKRR